MGSVSLYCKAELAFDNWAGKSAAAAAATAAYEEHLDHAVSLGWAFVERLCFEVSSPLA